MSQKDETYIQSMVGNSALVSMATAALATVYCSK